MWYGLEKFQLWIEGVLEGLDCEGGEMIRWTIEERETLEQKQGHVLKREEVFHTKKTV